MVLRQNLVKVKGYSSEDEPRVGKDEGGGRCPVVLIGSTEISKGKTPIKSQHEGSYS